jgi:hypothetical protein
LANKACIPEETIFRLVEACESASFSSEGGYSVFGKKTYIVYGDIRFHCQDRKPKMANNNKEEIRWQVVKAMLDEFPALRAKVKNYVKTEN